MRVRYAASALRQLDEIFGYIAKDSPAAASRIVKRVQAVARLLGEQPEMGRLTDFKAMRALPVWGTPYILYYTIRQDEIWIARIRHGARRRLF